MVKKAVIPAVEASGPQQAAAVFISDGIPLDLVGHAAKEYADQCRAVRESLGLQDSVLAVKLLAAQVAAATHLHVTQDDLVTGERLADQARMMAQRLGDDVAHAYALAAWGFTHPAPEHAAARVAAGNEVLEVATRYGESALVPLGYVLVLVGLLEQGNIRSLDTELLSQRAKADHAGYEQVVRWFRCLRSILDGDTVRAEHEADDLLANSELRGTAARALHTTQMGMIRWMQGRMDGAEQAFLATRREYPEQLLWTASLVWLWLLQGRVTSADALARSMPDVDELPRDQYWLSTVTVLADIARVRGSREEMERFRELLLPHVALLVPVGVGVAFWGTCARTVGMLEERLGLLDQARAHLEMAIEMTGRIGAIAWHAEAQIELAEFALRHGLHDIAAYELLAEARATSDARGFVALARRAMYRPRVKVLGGFEVISLCGTRADWTSRKARELLKMLVAARGRAVSREVLMDVLWPGEPPALLGNRFSVAVNVIRRALDPNRLLPTQHHLVTEGDAVRLDIDHLDIDLERFLALAKHDDNASRQAALGLYRGDAFMEDPYADWAVAVRDHAQHVRRSLD